MYQTHVISVLISFLQLIFLAGAAPQTGPAQPGQTGSAIAEASVKRDYFYVGGQYVPAAPPTNGTIMTGQIYVEHLIPVDCGVSQKYPLVLWHGAAQTGTNWLNTPDGREGWASYFLNQGYEVVSSLVGGRFLGCCLY